MEEMVVVGVQIAIEPNDVLESLAKINHWMYLAIFL